MSSPGTWLFAFGLCLVLYVGCEKGEDSPTAEVSPRPPSTAEGDLSVPPQLRYDTIEVDNGGRVRGRVRVSGSAPILKDLPVGKDQGVCGEAIPNPSLRLDSGGAVENAVVSLVGVTSGKELRPLPRVAEIEIVRCQLVPRHLLVPVGSTLEIVNSDPILHDIQARVDETMLFDVALPIQHFRIQRKLEHPGIVTFASGSGHTWLSGYVVVQEHPYYARTDSRGAYTIDAIPPGTYQLRVWHELLEAGESSLIIEPGGTVTADFELEARIGDR